MYSVTYILPNSILPIPTPLTLGSFLDPFIGSVHHYVTLHSYIQLLYSPLYHSLIPSFFFTSSAILPFSPLDLFCPLPDYVSCPNYWTSHYLFPSCQSFHLYSTLNCSPLHQFCSHQSSFFPVPLLSLPSNTIALMNCLVVLQVRMLLMSLTHSFLHVLISHSFLSPYSITLPITAFFDCLPYTVLLPSLPLYRPYTSLKPATHPSQSSTKQLTLWLSLHAFQATHLTHTWLDNTMCSLVKLTNQSFSIAYTTYEQYTNYEHV